MLTARDAGERDPAGAANAFRTRVTRSSAMHPDSPITIERRPAWSARAGSPTTRRGASSRRSSARPASDEFELDLAEDGVLRCGRVGYARFNREGRAAALALYWFEGYGGGLWLPFLDATSGVATYGGGRYLYDTIKGADLGVGATTIVLDFNFAYNPSCAYDERWPCPLSPPENRLPFAVEAGERMS